MSTKIVTKECLLCKNEFTGNYQSTFCDNCKKIKQQEYDRKRSKDRTIRKRKQLSDNIPTLNLRGLDYLPKNFNKKSPINYSNYVNHFKYSWYEILKYYGKFDELKKALLLEYKKFYEATNCYGYELFLKHIDTSQDILKHLDFEEFRNSIGKSYIRKSDEELRKNFFELVGHIGRLPHTQNDFDSSKIHLNVYRKRFKLNKNVIENIVREYITDEEILLRYTKEKTHKNKVFEESRKRKAIESNSRKKEDMLIDGKNAVDSYLSETGRLPVSRVFQDMTGMGTHIIKRKFNMGYREFISYLGYDLTKYKFNKYKSTEIEVLDCIANILNVTYISQKTFDWLNGTRNYPLKCDGYFENHNLIVEYDGRQHFEPVDFAGRGEEWALANLKEIQLNDEIKNRLIPQHNIKLLRIAYNEPFKDANYLKFRLQQLNIS